MAWSDEIASVNAHCLDAFGESVTYDPGALTGSPFSATVIWSDDEARMPEGIKAQAWVRLSDFTVKPKKGDNLTRAGIVYRVAELPQADGNGGAYLLLRVAVQPIP